MHTPVQVTFRDMPVSDAVEAACWKEAEKLDRFHPRITSCRVIVEAPHRHRTKGQNYLVKINMAVPGGEVVVNRDHHDEQAHEDVYIAIRDAFSAARRRLEDFVRRQRGDVKAHDEPTYGRIREINAQQACGLIEAPDGREVYFHRNSVLDNAWERLAIGSEVRYVEETGRDGPQASSVVLYGRHHGQHLVG